MANLSRTYREYIVHMSQMPAAEELEFGLKWIHTAWYELILRLDGALWLTIIFRPLLTQKRTNNASFVQ